MRHCSLIQVGIGPYWQGLLRPGLSVTVSVGLAGIVLKGFVCFVEAVAEAANTT